MKVCELIAELTSLPDNCQNLEVKFRGSEWDHECEMVSVEDYGNNGSNVIQVVMLSEAI